MTEAPRIADGLRQELAQAHRDLFDERASISRLTEDMEATRRDAEGNAQRFESTRHHLEALASELAQTREALQSREHDYAIVADEIDAFRVQLSDLHAEAESALRARDGTQRQLTRMTAERDAARHALEVATAERTAAEEGIRQSGEALQVLRDELPRRALAESQLAREREAAQLTLRTVIDKLAAVEEMLSERNAYIAELVQRHNVLAARLNTLDRNALVRTASWLARTPTGKR
jgi:chromosome segregation ATPase